MLVVCGRARNGRENPKSVIANISLRHANVKASYLFPSSNIDKDHPLRRAPIHHSGEMKHQDADIAELMDKHLKLTDRGFERFFDHFGYMSITVPLADVHNLHIPIARNESRSVATQLRRWKESFDVKGDEVTYNLYFPSDNHCGEWLDALPKTQLWANPFAVILGDCRGEGGLDGNTHQDLQFDNVPRSGKDNKPKVAGTSLFMSEEHRTVAHQVGTVLEHQYIEERALVLREKRLPATLIPMSNSAWNQSTAMDTHGIPSDGAPTKYFVAVYLNYVKGGKTCSHDIVVNKDERCTMYFPDMKYNLRQPPEGEMSKGDCAKHGKQLAAQLQSVYSHALLTAKQSKDKDDYDMTLSATYTNQAVAIFQKYLKAPYEDIIAAYPDRDRDYHILMSVNQAANDIVPDDPYYEWKCNAWVREHSTGVTDGYDEQWGPGWRARRVALPTNVRNNVALFIADVPREQPWFAGYEAPPVRVNTFVLDLTKATLDGMLNDVGEKASEEVIVWVRPNDITAKRETWAVHSINQASETSIARQKGRYLLAFKDVPQLPKTDYLTKFSKLKEALRNGVWPEEQAAIIRTLKDNHGMVLVEGVPGAGKSAMMRHVCHGAVGSSTDSHHIRVAYLLPANRQIDDAQEKLSALMTNSNVLRMFPWDKTIRVVIEGASNTETFPLEGTEFEISAQEFANQVAEAQKHLDPSENEESVAMVARRLFETNDAAAFRMMESNRHCNKTEFAEQVTTYKQKAAMYTTQALLQAHVVCCTPATYIDLMNHTREAKLQFDVIVVDEAGAMPEAQALAPVACSPEALILWCGDNSQIRPVVPSFGDLKFCNPFAEQRQVPILLRANLAGHAFMLKQNRRVIGNVQDWVAKVFYDGQMDIVERKKALPKLDEWLEGTFGVRVPFHTVAIEVENAVDSKIGTTRFNPAHADQIEALIVHVHTTYPDEELKEDKLKLLVVTPYTAQKRELLQRVKILQSKKLIPLGCTDVRTIDEAPSMEGDVVITDLVTNNYGSRDFVDDKHKVDVGASRARLLQIVIGNCSYYRRWSDLYDYCKNRHSAFSVDALTNQAKFTPTGEIVQFAFHCEGKPKVWDVQICGRCKEPGHHEARCPQKVTCNLCKESGHKKADCSNRKKCNICDGLDHLERNCPERLCHIRQ